jgi:hypothetical protein
VSEVDRLSNSGLYPALPIADKRRDREGQAGTPPDSRGNRSEPNGADKPQADAPRPPKSGIDEYA